MIVKSAISVLAVSWIFAIAGSYDTFRGTYKQLRPEAMRCVYVCNIDNTE